MRVTNKHDAALNVAGVDIRPKASANVTDDAFNGWKRGNAAKQWLKLGLIVAEDDDVKPGDQKAPEKPAETDKKGPAKPGDEKADLIAQAKAKGLNPNATMSVETLKKMIAEK